MRKFGTGGQLFVHATPEDDVITLPGQPSAPRYAPNRNMRHSNHMKLSHNIACGWQT